MRLPDYFDLGGQKLGGSWRLVIGRQESAVEDKSCSNPGSGNSRIMAHVELSAAGEAEGNRRASSADKTAVHVGAVLLKNK